MPVQCDSTRDGVMEGREPVRVTVVVLDTSNGPVTIEASAGGTVALFISADAIVIVLPNVPHDPSLHPSLACWSLEQRVCPVTRRGQAADSWGIREKAADGGAKGYPIG